MLLNHFLNSILKEFWEVVVTIAVSPISVNSDFWFLQKFIQEVFAIQQTVSHVYPISYTIL